MKKLILTGILLISTGTYACVEGVCKGDIVIPHSYIKGNAEVMEVDTRTWGVRVQATSTKDSESYRVSELAITRGCLGKLCVDQRVIPDSYARGFAFIEGVNRFRKIFTLNGNLSSDYHRKRSRELGFTSGCLQKVCIGDKVLPQNYNRGFAMVESINPYTRTFTVKGNLSKDYDRYMVYEMGMLEESDEYTSEQRQNGTF